MATSKKERDVLDAMREDLEQLVKDELGIIEDQDDDDWFENTQPLPVSGTVEHLVEYGYAFSEPPVQSIGQMGPRLKTIGVPMPWGVQPVSAGPYRECPKSPEYFGVKMAKEINASCVVDCPTVDFQTPPPDLLEQAIMETLVLARNGRIPYVGCMGGVGRTGTFLAVLYKVGARARYPYRFWKREDPVDWVRKHYRSHACETSAQEHFVRTFNVAYLAEFAKYII